MPSLAPIPELPKHLDAIAEWVGEEGTWLFTNTGPDEWQVRSYTDPTYIGSLVRSGTAYDYRFKFNLGNGVGQGITLPELFTIYLG